MMEQNKLPNATAVLVLGILSICTCCCWGPIGLALGIIALVLAKKDDVLYLANPELYSNYSNIKTGRILAIIGIVLNVISTVLTIYSMTTDQADNVTQLRQLLEQYK
ncbi:MAG: DUF4190 domain-containing protein [Flavobacterium sp.]|uniref:CCC motif membrane protein n=1 Tax=Flavobacterium sp. TaxID=239 RepID=UPI0012050A45|nr:CCC motif membrane protein [Flavobacterium sp.]RZJ67604.1 MAG: DUF4190 domain-containing protein [Flavobacterium sp.]